MTPLTAKQAELLRYLQSRKRAPTFAEMTKALGLRSKSGTHRLVTGLEERGFIRRIPNRARCIEVMPEPKLPEVNTLNAMPTSALAAEARRRGLVLGEYHRFTARIGGRAVEKRRFMEIA